MRFKPLIAIMTFAALPLVGAAPHAAAQTSPPAPGSHSN